MTYCFPPLTVMNHKYKGFLFKNKKFIIFISKLDDISTSYRNLIFKTPEAQMIDRVEDQLITY
ncbi:MAG: hypothetical protein B7Y39_18945 [Bdellovibrio sp. 28-41-41]|nr:MAG: hypothetical protein B7Y39_18945 [Bdellovibrio sp. 28-41-41]